MDNFWKKCSTCKKEIGFNRNYYVCSISTCRTKATNYTFCSVPCWDAHIPVERHRGDDVAAIEKRSPSQSDFQQHDTQVAGRRIVVAKEGAGGEVTQKANTNIDDEILVVVSKVKKYISEKSNMNTSSSTMDALSDRIKRLCDRAIEEARRQGRKTVMDRDVP